MSNTPTLTSNRALRRTTLFPEYFDFKQAFFSDQIITYLGNKRQLLPFINEGILRAKKILGKKLITSFDGFSGSGIVARLLKYHSKELWVNDLEDYCEVLNNCYLSNASKINFEYIDHWMQWLEERKISLKENTGFIERHYAPNNDQNIQPGERAFYTQENARIIDTVRTLIDENIESNLKDFFIAPLLVEASIHTNTSGIFKGFHKKNGVGHFGGEGENALKRIKAQIRLSMPIFSDVECDVVVKKMDTNELIKDSQLPYFDIAYYDPPYNQHPYGSNYFMLNLIARNHLGDIQNGVSGITREWNRSDYNKKQQASNAMDELIKNTPAKIILISYNNEGIISISEMKKILSKHGKLAVLEKDYNTYRGSRNLHKRSIKVKELLWIVKKP